MVLGLNLMLLHGLTIGIREEKTPIFCLITPTSLIFYESGHHMVSSGTRFVGLFVGNSCYNIGYVYKLAV